MFQFEHPFGDSLTGEASVVVKDPQGIEPPATIIQTDDEWTIEVHWSLDGPAAPFLCGQWQVAAFVESIGPGEEKQVGETQTVPMDAAPPLPTPRTYTTTIVVPAGELAVGAYKLVTLINANQNGVPLEMAAFIEGPILQFYESGSP